MHPKLWQAALAAALLAAGCGVSPVLTVPSTREQAASPVLMPKAEARQQRLRTLESLPVCSDGVATDGNTGF